MTNGTTTLCRVAPAKRYPKTEHCLACGHMARIRTSRNPGSRNPGSSPLWTRVELQSFPNHCSADFSARDSSLPVRKFSKPPLPLGGFGLGWVPIGPSVRSAGANYRQARVRRPGGGVLNRYLSSTTKDPSPCRRQTWRELLPRRRHSGGGEPTTGFSPASGRGQEKRDFHRRATFPTFCHSLFLSARVLPQFVICCQMSRKHMP